MQLQILKAGHPDFVEGGLQDMSIKQDDQFKSPSKMDLDDQQYGALNRDSIAHELSVSQDNERISMAHDAIGSIPEEEQKSNEDEGYYDWEDNNQMRKELDSFDVEMSVKQLSDLKKTTKHGFNLQFGQKQYAARKNDTSSSDDSDTDTSDEEEIKHEEIAIDMDSEENIRKNKLSQLLRQGSAMGILENNNYCKVPDNNDTGKMINLIFKMYKNSSSKPLWRGKNKVLLYDNESKTEPALVLGPEWRYALWIFILVNIVVGIVIDQLTHKSFMFNVCLLSLFLWDCMHLILVISNPGIAPRDPYIHSDDYLHQLQRNNKSFKVCSRCKVIERESGQFRSEGMCRTVDHCPWCDVCIEGHDHHCKIIGKCVGKNNSRLYGIYLFLCTFQVFSFVFSVLMLTGL